MRDDAMRIDAESSSRAEVPPFRTGDVDLPDDVYDALIPLDGFAKGSRGGPRIYRYDHWWVSISLSDFGDLIVGPWGEWQESSAIQDGRLFQAMCDLEWHGAGHPTIWTRGTHINWTEVVVGEHAFNIDDEQDRKRLIEWGDAMRHRKANAPKPEPPSRVETPSEESGANPDVPTRPLGAAPETGAR